MVLCVKGLVQTRRVYRMESSHDWPVEALLYRSESWLRGCCREMWESLGHCGRIDLYFHRGRGPWRSWANIDAGEIVLHEHHRCVLTLAHEVSHMHIGYCEDRMGDHGPKWLWGYAYLLDVFACVEVREFRRAARRHGVVLWT